MHTLAGSNDQVVRRRRSRRCDGDAEQGLTNAKRNSVLHRRRKKTVAKEREGKRPASRTVKHTMYTCTLFEKLNIDAPITNDDSSGTS